MTKKGEDMTRYSIWNIQSFFVLRLGILLNSFWVSKFNLDIHAVPIYRHLQNSPQLRNSSFDGFRL